MRIILDTDTGVDDALAIALALRSPELEVVALTAVSGNVHVDRCAENVLRVLDVVEDATPGGLRRPPVFKGEAEPLARPLLTAPEVHGTDGLGGITLLPHPVGGLKYPPPRVELASESAPRAILDLIAQYPDELTLVAVGPLTNVARAALLHPARMRRMRQIVVMGGAFRVHGNTTPVAEFNVYVDPHAAQVVLDLGVPLTLVPLDVTEQCILRPEHLESAPAAPPSLMPFVADVSQFYIRYHEEHDGFAGSYLHDPLAVAVAADPTLVETRAVHVDVETAGEHTIGMTIADLRERPHWTGSPNAHVCVAVDAERFLQRFLQRLSGAC
jgi:inosine-uridine nucleoside N-ribohydrolase